MEIETKIIYTEIIKPSSPTPKSLQKHKLSFLDQLAPPLFMPLVYFYTLNPIIPNSQKSDQLKKSLSEALSRFYPLAGRLVDNLYVDCNDSGAPFSEAEADCDLSHAISISEPKNIKIFLPYKMIESQDFCMAVQATYFLCGGLAVGLLISHKIADVLSSFVFVNNWSAVARNGERCDGVPLPKFDAAAYFPPKAVSGFSPSTEGMMKEELTTRIFTFPAAKIAALREKYSHGGAAQPRPTRVQALSAFIWTRFICATGIKADPNIKTYAVNHAVNLRTRVEPPLSEYHFGNLSWTSIAKLAAGDSGVDLVEKVREAMKAVKVELNLMREIMGEASRGELVTFSFTSLCGFPIDEADFGWGEPVWVGTPGLPYKNFVSFTDFTDTKNRSGIEAWVHLKKQDMDKFEADLELQEFISHDMYSP